VRLTALIADGTLFAALLGFTLLEMLGLVLWRRLSGRGLPVMDVVFHLAAGAFLTLACFLALKAASPWLVLGCFAASGVAHVVDLRRRWPGPR
jgi:hypothetical protein